MNIITTSGTHASEANAWTSLQTFALTVGIVSILFTQTLPHKIDEPAEHHPEERVEIVEKPLPITAPFTGSYSPSLYERPFITGGNPPPWEFMLKGSGSMA